MFKSNNLFAQILQLVSRPFFDQCVRRHSGEKSAKGFTCWQQFVAMMFCQLGNSKTSFMPLIPQPLTCASKSLIGQHLGVPRELLNSIYNWIRMDVFPNTRTFPMAMYMTSRL